ncbi:MAG: bifunctional diaminohydroxyphosphoribosylaminopyrimidine deaminase/5-amino-6-(5-phosphoribosylamino)uracil reductase RibD [Actinomycetota bacterium]|nr:bifunctional diaminohydroxyphosphoribosylaminopyrimidine deaminase/5-amino-6-(5-phosphoribosylamino)uracil reductase RibD [Actinomycetota bacterium]
MASEAERGAMRRALELAARGAATVRPNPVVGAVVLDGDGRVVGEGWHERAGQPHAEVHALRAAGERARGATVVVTLEPCDTTGRTGPCTTALLQAGVRRVVYAVDDPTSAGGGAARLRAAGVQVEGRVLTAEAERVAERWLTVVRAGRPHVTWKYAATLDGRVAAADGSSRWITGQQARADVHELRAGVDAILVGVGTVLVDDPHLTARSPDGALLPLQPLRVVADTQGRTPATARVRDGAAPTWVATAAELGRGLDGRLDLEALLKELLARDVRSVLVEGGPTLAASLLRAGLVDRVVAYVAPALLGAGPAALGDVGIGTIAAALRLDLDDVTPIGADLRLSARVTRARS